jgi:hypothetical protein
MLAEGPVKDVWIDEASQQAKHSRHDHASPQSHASEEEVQHQEVDEWFESQGSDRDRQHDRHQKQAKELAEL